MDLRHSLPGHTLRSYWAVLDYDDILHERLHFFEPAYSKILFKVPLSTRWRYRLVHIYICSIEAEFSIESLRPDVVPEYMQGNTGKA